MTHCAAFSTCLCRSDGAADVRRSCRTIGFMTNSSTARRKWAILASLGGLLLVAAAAAAVLEGYASDAEQRTGDLTFAIVLAAIGVIAGVVGFIGMAMGPGRTHEASVQEA